MSKLVRKCIATHSFVFIFFPLWNPWYNNTNGLEAGRVALGCSVFTCGIGLFEAA